MDWKTFVDLRRTIRYARKKHPEFAKDINHALVILAEEFGEVAKAVYDNDLKNAREELLDVIAVSCRFIDFLDGR